MGIYWTSGYAATTEYPMTHARILYNKLDGAVTADSEDEGFEAILADSPKTYTYWKPVVSPAGWEIDYGDLKPVDTVAIAVHELAGGIVTVKTWDGAAWVTQISQLISEDATIILLFQQVTTQKVRVEIDILAAVGVIWTGTSLVMCVPAFMSLGMIDMGRETTFSNNISEGGHWLGRSIARSGISADYSWEHIPWDWYKTNIEPLSKYMRTKPIFIAARPYGYPDEVAYAWTSKDVLPEKVGITNMLKFGMSLSGFSRA